MTPSETTTPSFEALSRARQRQLIVWATLRTIGTVAVVVVVYYLIPMDKTLDVPTVIELALGLLAVAAVVAFQVVRTTRAEYPTIRAVESLAFTIPVYVLLFATIYFLVNRANTASFGIPLTRTDTLYFSTTVLTTVGFGDIAAKTQTARVIVTSQMAFDLLFMGVVVRLVVNAIKVGRSRHVA